MSQPEEIKPIPILENLAARVQASVSGVADSKNFTYLIGNNGTGKSRLLSELALKYQENFAGNVLCICNGVLDRFPWPSKGSIIYLGSRQSSNAIFVSASVRTLGSMLFQGIERSEKFLPRLEELLKYKFSIALKRKIGDPELELIFGVGSSAMLSANVTQSVDDKSWFSVCLSSINKFAARHLVDYIARASRWQLNRMELYVSKGNIKFPLSSLSSGEQNHISTFIKVTSHAASGCLLLIDEPEISLHMHWQINFHKNLLLALKNIPQFHAIIATHSPVIVSEAVRIGGVSTVILQGEYSEKDMSGNGKLDFMAVPSKTELNDQVVKYLVDDKNVLKSYSEVVVNYFKTSPYNDFQLSKSIADLLLEAWDKKEPYEYYERGLEELKRTKNLTEQDEDTIRSAKEVLEGFRWGNKSP